MYPAQPGMEKHLRYIGPFPFIPAYFPHIPPTPVYLSKTIVFLLLLPNPRLKQEMQRSILSKSIGKGFSTFFSLSSLSKSF